MPTYLSLFCTNCGKSFKRTKSNACKTIQKKSNHFCSRKCRTDYQKIPIETKCGYCNKKMITSPCLLKRSQNNMVFCSHKCSTTYYNIKRVRKGGIRSKLEVYIGQQLAVLYPLLEILYNDRKTINGELDIYIPSLQLAFELNGIFHYEPIFGNKSLQKIQNNDKRKFQACIENKIDLCIIDTSQHTYVTPKTSQKYLKIITDIINQRLS
jgi:hypothetical protein